MTAVDRSERKRVYNSFVSNMANGHPLPSLRLFPGSIPACIADLADRLYMGMSAIDYRYRNCNFQNIFHQIDRSLYVLANDAKYKRLKALREKYRLLAEEKKQRALAMRDAMKKTVQV